MFREALAGTRIPGRERNVSTPSFVLWVLLGFLWLNVTGFQAEFSGIKEDPDSIVFKEPEASCCRLDGLNPAVESLGDSITDWRSKPCQESVEAGLQHPRDLLNGIEPTADSPRVP
jgi:hypothetical protein